MKFGINFEQGEIVFIPFPFTNLKSTKKRPVLILSRTDYNRKSIDFISCGITSNIKNIDHSVLIDNKDLKEGYLPKPSRIKVNTIFTLEKSSVIRSYGKVKDEIMGRVKAELYKLF
ncbi:MAG: type II toxin-antitoxin system PemK/MazF family toxin [Candidatus Aenigmarchaeota archaeon]|nr:type II toxin-antitoxin system PemK/MazF family toxin [Candidatus Aenigmarchaeota archaeon]